MVSKNSELFCVAFMISILTKNSYELSKESIVFVDLKISVKNSKIITDLNVRSTDRHQYFY